MPHLHTNPGEHDFTVSAYIIRLDEDEPKVLLHMHKILGRWLQFGGHIEATENPWQSITNELREETGYSMEELQILQPKDRVTSTTGNILHPVPATYLTHQFGDIDHKHTDTAWVFTAKAPAINPINQGESSTIDLFSKDQLKTLDNSLEDVRNIALFALETCLLKWESLPASSFN